MGQAEAQQRQEAGAAARQQVPRASHADWSPAPDRPDPVQVLCDQDAGRLQWLVPVRHARMAESAFAFYRGGAAIMAADLAATPVMGATVQLCGDAHLSNFGTFASPERQQVFDVNDFDETLPGPWEWDVKRLAASMVIAARDNGLPDQEGRRAARAAVRAYRDAMARFASLPALEVWYDQITLEEVRAGLTSKSERAKFDARAAKARQQNSVRALGKLAETVDGQLRIKSQPPLLVPFRDLADRLDIAELSERMREHLHSYTASLQPDRRHLLERFTLVDLAIKVVGVGSVGTRCWIVLLIGRDQGEPLFLQVKEASESVLEGHLAASRYAHHGQRVVEGQRLMQASSDVFLGWSRASGPYQYYIRQFRDMKGSADVATMDAAQLQSYGRLCGWTLAHGHARSGDATTIAGYLGSGDTFPDALAQFALVYADQNEADFRAYCQAIADGRIEAHEA